MKILFTTVKLSSNLGYPSIVSAIVEMNKKYKDDLYIVRNCFSKKELELIKHYNLKYIDFPIFYKSNSITFIISLFIAILMKRKLSYNSKSKIILQLAELSSFDVVVDLAGIDFTDKFISKMPFKSIWNHRIWFLSKILNVAVIKYTTAIGPCEKFATKISLKTCSKFCDLFYLRDKQSFSVFNSLQIKTQSKIVPDTAFMMASDTKSKFSDTILSIRQQKKVVGLAVSYQHKNRTKNYNETLAQLVEYLENRDYYVLLIPNENNEGNQNADDRIVCKEILQMISDKNNVSILDVDNITPNQIKVVISCCDFIITSRYHTLIAALSTAKPTLALSWHHKYIEALLLFGLEDYVIETNNFNINNVISKFENMEENHQEIINKIILNLPSVQKEVINAFEYAREYITKKKDKQ